MNYDRNDFISKFKKLLDNELKVKINEDPVYTQNTTYRDSNSNRRLLVDTKYKSFLPSVITKLFDMYDNINLVDMFLMNRNSRYSAFKDNIILRNVRIREDKSWKQLLSRSSTYIVLKVVHDNDVIDVITSDIKANDINVNDTTLSRAFNRIVDSIEPSDFMSLEQFNTVVRNIIVEYIDKIGKYLNDGYNVKLILSTCVGISIYPNEIVITFELEHSYSVHYISFHLALKHDKDIMYEYMKDRDKIIDAFIINNSPTMTLRLNYDINRNNIQSYNALTDATKYLINCMLNDTNFIRAIVTSYFEYHFAPTTIYNNVSKKLCEYITTPNLTVEDILTYFKYITDADINKSFIEPICCKFR